MLVTGFFWIFWNESIKRLVLEGEDDILAATFGFLISLSV